MIRKSFVAASLVLFSFAGPIAQDRPLTLEDLYHPENRKDFGDDVPRSLRWLDDEHYLLPGREPSQGQTKVRAEDGSTSLLYDRDLLKAAFSQLAGFGDKDAESASRESPSAFRPRSFDLLLRYQGDLYLYETDTGTVSRLTDSPESEDQGDFSPDGRFVSFVRENDLYVIEIETLRERRLTQDGGSRRLNGKLDWVYQEEIYGRGGFKAYWWSPSSDRIAYLQLDETHVPKYNVVDHRQAHLVQEVMHYPKAGDPNPTVRLGVVSPAAGGTKWVDHSRYEGGEFLIVQVGWTPDGARVVYQLQDREQTWLDLNFADPATGKAQTAIHETSPAWVNNQGPPVWLADGSFLWLSERTGWQHIYHYSPSHQLIGSVTSGKWEVRRLHGVDASDQVYFSGTKRSSRDLDIYRVAATGGDIERLSKRSGTHQATFNDSCSMYLDRWSNVTTPPQIRLHDASGEVRRAVNENPVEALGDYVLSEPTFLQVPTRDGFQMEAMLIKPPNFDAARKYPVLSYTYSGPHAPRIRDSWGGRTYLWHQYLAQQGYLIWICDNRTASGKGAESTWPVYRSFGELELRDLEDGLDWLKEKPYVDGTRIGIWGWSFGGYMTSYALTHSKSFKVGIAGAPVTDWHLYDSIYTERYMGKPQNNPEGYEKSSALTAAADLHGKLLIIHGTIDDNVHMQNSIQFVDALQKAGKQFQFMVYPGSRHGVRDRKQVWHLRNLMTEFILKNL